MVTVTMVNAGAGRGAWPGSGVGGTLDLHGLRPGPYYRAPGAGQKMPGLIGALAVRNNATCNVNEYAVHMAVKALQPYFGATPDGILGPLTEVSIRAYQQANHLIVDGVIGPETSKSLFAPLVAKAAARVDGGLLQLPTVAAGHVGYESLWDAGAVGVSTPEDVGLGQINGPAHPTLTLDARLTPGVAINWVVSFVDSNIRSMQGNIRDGIAAYNLGVGGARSWVADGRPDVWVRDFHGTTYTTTVKLYIDRVLAAV